MTTRIALASEVVAEGRVAALRDPDAARIWACNCAHRVLRECRDHHPEDPWPALLIAEARMYAVGARTTDQLHRTRDGMIESSTAMWGEQATARHAALAAMYCASDDPMNLPLAAATAALCEALRTGSPGRALQEMRDDLRRVLAESAARR